MSINRRINILISAAIVFMFLTVVFCLGASDVNNINRVNKTAIEQLRRG